MSSIGSSLSHLKKKRLNAHKKVNYKIYLEVERHQLYQPLKITYNKKEFVQKIDAAGGRDSSWLIHWQQIYLTIDIYVEYYNFNYDVSSHANLIAL